MVPLIPSVVKGLSAFDGNAASTHVEPSAASPSHTHVKMHARTHPLAQL